MSKLFQFERRAGSRRDSEGGFVLLAVLFLVVLVLIGMAVAAPTMARSIQRDKELELVHRGEQYKRAIKLYYKKFGAYPTSIDQLLNTNDVKFLRKRYKDPITGKDDWRIIYFGQAKVPPMGLFGQPLGPTGQPGAPTTTGGGTSATGTAAPTSTPYNFTPPPNPFGPTPNASGSDSPDSGVTPSNDEGAASGSTDAGAGATSQPTTPTTSTGATPFGTSATASTNSPAGTPSSAFGASLGSNGPIVGVGIPSDKASLIEYKKQKQYNKWEFVYNPIEDQLLGGGLSSGAASGVNPAGTGAGNTGTGGGNSIGTGSPFESNTNSGAGPTPNSGSNTGVGSSTPMGSNPQQQ